MDLNNVNMICCDMTNCYVIRGKNGDVLIDTGLKKYRDEIETWLLNYNIKLIVLTHGHNDHIENAAYFSRLYGAKIAMCGYDTGLTRNNMRHKIYSVGIRGAAVAAVSKPRMKEKAEGFGIDVFLEDDMVIGNELGIECKAIQLDGHTRGSFGILCGGDLYVGDAAVNFVYPSFSVMCESPKAARASLEKIKSLSPKRIFFGHGMPIESGTKEYRRMFIR